MEASAELKAQYAWLSMAPNQAWFKAKQGHLEAQYVLGMCHLHGVQQDKSTKSAASWLSKAANSGHIAAQFQIGLLWLEGKGVTQQDETEATKWLQRAAAAGHTGHTGHAGHAGYAGHAGFAADAGHAVRLSAVKHTQIDAHEHRHTRTHARTHT